ncbi:FAD-dependent oxidoreductase [Ancylobacter dichloromethanicus]
MPGLHHRLVWAGRFARHRARHAEGAARHCRGADPGDRARRPRLRAAAAARSRRGVRGAAAGGAAEKVAFLFDRDVFGVEPTSYIDTLDRRDPARKPVNFVLNPFGAPMAIGQLGGDNAARLVQAGPAAMRDFALAALKDAFGADIERHIAGVATTGWVADPLIGGGYSCALPGLAHVRARLTRTLTEPVGERILFAGEAASPHAYSTAHGAHQTGLAAADTALALLRGRAA